MSPKCEDAELATYLPFQIAPPYVGIRRRLLFVFAALAADIAELMAQFTGCQGSSDRGRAAVRRLCGRLPNRLHNWLRGRETVSGIQNLQNKTRQYSWIRSLVVLR